MLPKLGEDAVLYCADVLEYLNGLPDSSVDMVIADPPYNIGFDGGKGWDRFASSQEYLGWCQTWTRECVRVLRPERMLVVWATLKTDDSLRYKLDVLNAMPELTAQNEVVWSYNWGGRSKTNFARKHELAWCYSKGEDFLFNADDVRIPRKMARNIRTGEVFEKGTIPTCVWQFNNHTTSADACNWHPTTKNLSVLTRLIRAYTNPGEVVCDPFFGSGATAIAALRSSRSFTGCEVDEEYFDKASARVATLS